MKQLLLIMTSLCFTACIREIPELRLASLFSDNMVLQQNSQVVIWGWGTPARQVKISASWGEFVRTSVDADGKWQATINTPSYGQTHSIEITSGKISKTINNILLGEVWVCSGQSNMEMPVMGWLPNDPILNSEQEIAAANYPEIRMFTIPRTLSVNPEDTCGGVWQICSPKTVGMFSAAAYFFGRELHRELGVPIGLIHSSWGGTPAEAWTPKETIATIREFDQAMNKLDESRENISELYAWLNDLPLLPISFESDNPWMNLNFNDLHVSDPGFNDSQWKTMDLPVTFEASELGQFDGAVWYRRNITIPESWTGKELTLELGPVDDMDITFFNGKKIGGYEEDGHWQTPRKYTISGETTTTGEVNLAVRVLDIRGGGGIFGEPQQMKIYPSDKPENIIPLSGSWKYLPVAIIHARNFRLFDIPTREYYFMENMPVELGPNTPTVLFNAMISPIVPYTIKGAIWYQGESNAGNPKLYSRLFPAMIESWRNRWGQGDFPFYFTQIAPFDYDRWGGPWAKAAELREAQTKTLSLKNTGMAITLDIGDPENIHPANKQEVGRRLALWALAKDYDHDIKYSGPIYRSFEKKDNTIIVYFDYAENGLVPGPKGLNSIQIAGTDRIFSDATATIDGNRLIVKSNRVPDPEAVRYLWDNRSEASLFNNHGLPAANFRTDNW